MIENFNIHYNQNFILNENTNISYNYNLNNIINIAKLYDYNLNIITNNVNNNYLKINDFQVDFNNNLINTKLFGINYNHNMNIVKLNELQLIDGYFQNTKKIDYTNNINNNLIIYPNYNVYNINNYNFEKNKFITLKYSNILNNSNKITIEFIESSNISSSNINIHLKIYDNNNKEITGWLDCNKEISMMGLNNYNKNVNGTGILKYDTSNLIKKHCYLPNETTGIIYLRCGININSNVLIKYIKITNGFN